MQIQIAIATCSYIDESLVIQITPSYPAIVAHMTTDVLHVLDLQL